MIANKSVQDIIATVDNLLYDQRGVETFLLNPKSKHYVPSFIIENKNGKNIQYECIWARTFDTSGLLEVRSCVIK